MARGGIELTPAQRIAWLRLIRTDNVGPQTFRQLVNREGSAEAAIAALPGLMKRVGALPRIPSVTEAEDEIAGLARLGGRLVGSGEPDYPDLLKYIAGVPPMVSMLGGHHTDWRSTVAMSASGQSRPVVIAITPPCPTITISSPGCVCTTWA